MIRFSKFLQDNEAKRVRAVKKVADERKMKESKELEIEQVVRAPLLCAPGLFPIAAYLRAGLSSQTDEGPNFRGSAAALLTLQLCS